MSPFPQRLRARLAILGAVAAFSLLGASTALGATRSDGEITMTLLQSKPELHATGASAKDPRDGDGLTVFATLREGGTTVGKLTGIKIAVRSAADAPDLAAKHEVTRVSLLQFSFSGDDAFFVEGLSLDEPDGLVPGAQEVRAITGGTGKYKFARGQVTTTRNADGTYTHVVDLRI